MPRIRVLVLFGFVLSVSCVLIGTSVLALSIGGVVRQPMTLTSQDMANMAQVEAKLTEVTKDGRHQGVFVFRGIPLRTLLSMTDIRKEVLGYARLVDLAIVLHSRDGRVAVLSWGEVFYRNPAEILIALSSSPVVPHAVKECGECHGPDIYKPALDQLGRKILFPRLVVTTDFYTDRCLEDITHIEVVEPKRATTAIKEEYGTVSSASSGLEIRDGSTARAPIADTARYSRSSVMAKEVGSGRGYHGVKTYEGIPLREVIGKAAGEVGEIDKVALITGSDGYQSLFSFGEIFLSTLRDRIMLADIRNSSSLGQTHGHWLVAPDDNSSERLVKNVTSVEIISLKELPRVYVIGFGCGDTSLITLEAISHMGKVGAFVSAADFADRFSKYLGDKPVLFDPFTSWEPVYRKNHPGLSDEEVREETARLRAAEIKSVWDTLKAGKSVAVLEPGDPTIYGGWQNWLWPEFEGRTEIITGVSAFSAGNAMMGRNIVANDNSIVITTPWALLAHEETVKSVAAAGDVMAIFMGLKDVQTLVPMLAPYYPPHAPVTIAYKAGISHEKSLVHTRLDRLAAVAAKEGETFLGLIYIGR
jgi:precorrin-4 methylase